MKQVIATLIFALLISALLFVVLTRAVTAEAGSAETLIQAPRPEPVQCEAMVYIVPEPVPPISTPMPLPVPDHRYWEQVTAMASDMEAADRTMIRIVPEVPEIPEEPEVQQPAMVYLGSFWCTGYDACASCCDKTDGITSSGTVATVGRTVAAGSQFAYGTRLYIEGIGERVVEDRGGGIGGTNLDVFCADHPACYQVTGWHDVYLME